MSQHLFTGLRQPRFHGVLMGWDKPLQYYFMVIYKTPDDDTPFFSNLNLARECYTLAYYRAVLSRVSIELPEAYFDSVYMDGKRNEGNKEVTHWITEMGVYCQQDGIDWEALGV